MKKPKPSTTICLQLRKQLAERQKEISSIYHAYGDVDGYPTMQVYLLRKGIDIRKTMAHKYMNTEMQLFSIVGKKKWDPEKGTAHKVFEKELYSSIEEFAYEQYNHVCPHSYDNYKTPFEARYGD